MMRFEMNIDDRKKLAKRLAELTGLECRYTGVPYCVYRIGEYTVGRDGSVEVEDENADRCVLNTLISEGMLAGGLLAEPEETELEETGAEESEPVTEGQQEEAAVLETEPESESGQEVEAEPEVETEPEVEAEQEIEPGQEAGNEQETETVQGDVEPEEEPKQETETQPEEEDQQEETEPEDTQQEETGPEEPQSGERDFLDISFPADKHTGTSLRNLIYLIYSRGPLINKALGTHFSVEKSLVDALADDRCTQTQENFRRAIADYEDTDGNGLGMEGITITPEQVTLHGFPVSEDADRMKACTDLAELMNKMAISQKRIQAKTVAAENEKYAMRIWLVRMGMGGADYKQTRAILMENLCGNCAFRTEADAEKFKAEQKAKRDAKKAAAAAEEAAQEPTESSEGGACDE